MGQYRAIVGEQLASRVIISSGQKELPEKGVMNDYFHWNQIFCSPFISQGWRFGAGWLVINTVKDGVWKKPPSMVFVGLLYWSGLCWATVPLRSCLALTSKNPGVHTFFEGISGGTKIPLNSWVALGGFCFVDRGFLKWWYPQIIHFNRVFHYKPSILGYHYFWKHPDICWFGEIFKVRLLGGCLGQGWGPTLGKNSIHQLLRAHHPGIWMLQGWLGKWKS